MGESLGMRGKLPCKGRKNHTKSSYIRREKGKIAANPSEDAEKIAANKAEKSIKSPYTGAGEKIIFYSRGKNQFAFQRLK